MDEPVDHRGGDHVVAEDLAPGAEGLVGGDDHRGALVARRDQAEHQVGGLGVERDVADLVDDEQRDEAEAAQLGLEAALALGLGEPGDPLGRGRELRPAGRPGRRGSTSAIARWVLPVPGGPSRTTFSLACRKSSWPRCSTTGLLDRALEGEVELLQGLAGREAGGLDPALAAVAVARGDLGGEQRLGEALVAPLLLAGALGELRQRPGGGRRLQRAEQVRELGRSCSCRDQRVVARQRPQLDLDVVGAPAPVAAQRARAARWCAGSVMVRPPAKTRRWRAASSPVSSTTAVISRWRDAHLDPAARERAGRASSRCESTRR